MVVWDGDGGVGWRWWCGMEMLVGMEIVVCDRDGGVGWR